MRLRSHCLSLVATTLATLAAAETSPSAPTSNRWQVIFAPAEILYPEYLASPRRPQTSAAVMQAFNSDLVDEFAVGSSRYGLNIGERFRTARLETADYGDFELAMEAGFFGQFDIEESLDNIGWDGWYGALLSWRGHPRYALKLHYRHLSSHLGDEFIERTGRKRRGYTREDFTFGGIYDLRRFGEVYAEYGYGTHLGSPDQQRGYAQLGWQLRRPDRQLWNRWGWQLGVDSTFFEENDWQPNLTLQAALLLAGQQPDHGLRLALEAYTGRYLIGELNDLDESYISFVVGWEY